MDQNLRDALKRILLEWQAFRLPDVHPRDVDARSLVSQPITAIIGPRRAGKTWLCFQAIRELLARGIPRERILFVSLEDERLHPSTGDELTHLLDAHRESRSRLRAHPSD